MTNVHQMTAVDCIGHKWIMLVVIVTKKKPLTQTDIIKSIRREPVPSGKTFQVKKKKLHRKRKHKGKVDTSEE
jgi:hypothetical protein